MEENKNQIPEQETTPVVEAKKSFIQKLGKKKLIAIKDVTGSRRGQN